MAKRAKKKKAKKKKSRKARQAKTAKRKVTRKTAAPKRKKASRVQSAKKTARKESAKKKRKARAPRRTEADMSWSEVRERRRKRSEGRFDRIQRDFDRAVNMTPKSLEDWLQTKESREVGWKRSEAANEPVGHWSGQRIVEIKNKRADELTPADYSHMRKVVAYVKRHGAQRPEGDVKETPWRYSLMNWGHDPMK